MQNVQIAIAGVGLVGRRHADAINHLKHVTLCGVVDPSDAGRAFARERGVPCFDTLGELFAAQSPDGVILATPTLLHVEQGLDCVQRGCPVLVEKPLATSAEAAQLLVDQAEAADVPVLVGHHRRHNPLIRKALPEDAIITTDVGWNKNGVGQQFDILTPGSILTPGGFATMGFGPPGAIGAKLAAPDRVVVSLVGDGGFGQNPSMLATAVELDLGIIWLVMNNNAFGTIAGLQKAHYGLTYGTTFPGSAAAPTNGPGYADIARAYGAEGHRLSAADELLPALEAAIASGKPTVLDVPMINNPTPTTGHWNILDIYSPDKDVSHVAT